MTSPSFPENHRSIMVKGSTLIGNSKNINFIARLKELNIFDSTYLFEWLSTDELAKVLQTLDIYVIPSYQEGICIAGLEAMASGCPVISTKCGGPEDFVFHKKNGLLVDFDKNSLTNAIVKLCSDRKIRNEYSNEAIKNIEINFSKDNNKKKFQKCLNEVFL